MICLTVVIEDSVIVLQQNSDGRFVGRVADTFAGKATDVNWSFAEVMATLNLSMGVGEEQLAGYDPETLYAVAPKLDGFSVVP